MKNTLKIYALAGLACITFATSQLAAAACFPTEIGANRESPSYRASTPSADLSRAVAAFKAADAKASFNFFNCEVDSFSTSPKSSIPAYALPILRNAGLSIVPQVPELLPQPTLAAKPAQALDSAALRTRNIPLGNEVDNNPSQPPVVSDVVGFDPGAGSRPLTEARVQPAIFLEPTRAEFVAPTRAQIARNAVLVKPILASFLNQNANVFRLGSALTAASLPTLTQTGYIEGRYFRKATFQQTLGGEPLLDGKTLVFFDVNWNVTAISRMLVTPEKLAIPRGFTISRTQAILAATFAVVRNSGVQAAFWQLESTDLGPDMVRGLRAWDVRLVAKRNPAADFTVRLRASDGHVLNISDNIDAFTDAKARRWAYTAGSLATPVQTISTVFTRDDNTLVHDFFFLQNDNRGGIATPLTGFQTETSICTQTPRNSSWRPLAHGTTSGPVFVRPTHRNDRDFGLWSPADVSGTFGETQTYFWARQMMQWVKPALNDLGVLPSDPNDWPRVNIVVNDCVDDFYSNGADITSEDNAAEVASTIQLREDCKSTNVNCSAADYTANPSSFVTCEGNGCYPSPSVIHHELNHFILGAYFGVNSKLDCSAGIQNKFLHEGTLGSVVPHSFWHFWNGVGFNPTTDKLFTSSSVRGRVHSNAATNLNINNFTCLNNDDGGVGNEQQPYEAGRVAGQPLWEIYHGMNVVGNSVQSTWRPGTDTFFLSLIYNAADLNAASTVSDRVQYANRIMEILDKNNWTSDALATYCTIWAHHGMAGAINPDFCS